MKIYVETDRLILRELLPTDIDGMFELDSDPEVHKYLGNKPLNHKSQVVEIIQMVRQQYVDNGIGRWAMIDRETNQFMGWTGLKLVKEEVNGHINFHDLGYRLIKKYWGQGFATEGAIASLNYGFKNLKLEKIFAATEVHNVASNRILGKIGFSRMETFNYDNSLHNWYELVRGDWRI